MLCLYNFSASEKSIIAEARIRNGSDNCWDDPQLSDLKSSLKTHYIREQHRRCAYCNKIYDSARHRVWDLDHVLPRNTFPQFTFDPRNIVASCVECNNWKSNKAALRGAATLYPRSSRRFLIIHRAFDDFRHHIVSNGRFFYQSVTEKGSYTIWACRLNRFLEAHLGVDFDILDDDFYELVGRLFSGDLDARIRVSEMLTAFLRAKREEELSRR